MHLSGVYVSSLERQTFTAIFPFLIVISIIKLFLMQLKVSTVHI